MEGNGSEKKMKLQKVFVFQTKQNQKHKTVTKSQRWESMEQKKGLFSKPSQNWKHKQKQYLQRCELFGIEKKGNLDFKRI